MLPRRTQAIINIKALHDNLSVIKSYAKNSKIIAMVKANAYGHGLKLIASNLPDVACFGVATVSEAIYLKENKIDNEIVVMSGFTCLDELKAIDNYNFVVVLHNFEQLKFIEDTNLLKPLTVWLKVDTGMNRLGFNVLDFAKAYDFITNNNKLVLKGVMSHLADSSNNNHDFTLKQIEKYNTLCSDYKFKKSLANSAAVLQYPQAHFDYIRPGLILYGVSPFDSKAKDEFNLKPVMTLKSRVIAIKDLNPGDVVSYGCAYKANKKTKIAVVGIGYGDGYPKNIKAGTKVLINNKAYEIVGAVCMDMLMVEIGFANNIQIDDEVTLWGDGLEVEQIAKCANTIPYDLLCSISRRVEHIELT